MCFHRAVKLLIFVTVFSFLIPPTVRAGELSPRCNAALNSVRLSNPLLRLGQKLASDVPITIVAIGSSSTAGSGASSPAASYPSRLAVELQQRFPNHPITVINRGVGGEEIGDMLNRFDDAVIANKPDLVLWQLGTNSVIRNHSVSDHGAAIRAGLKKIRTTGADIVLIDPQFAPKVIVKTGAERMVALIAATARQERVDLFRRFNVMRHWHDVEHLGFKAFIAPDGLHMNDWSYACMAKTLAMAIAEAAQRPAMSAKVTERLAP